MTDAREDVRILRDQQFAEPDGVPLLADVYLPAGAVRALPVIVWLHGGGWRYGTRRDGPDLSRCAARTGYAMAAVDYRSSRTARHPAQLQDVRAAIRWLRGSATAFGVDPDRVGLWGGSAGGHLAALAALAAAEASSFGEAGGAVTAVAAGYPPVDFLQLDAHRDLVRGVAEDPEAPPLPADVRAADPRSYESRLLGRPIGECPDLVRAANPAAHATPGAPPFLILHGRRDTAVPIQQSELLFAALASRGVPVTLCAVDDLGHGFLDRPHLDDRGPHGMTVTTHRDGVEHVRRDEAPVFGVVESFFREHLGGSGASR